MRQLIVNADGFGFTYGNNRAILEVLEHGFIRSVSVNVTFPAMRELPALIRQFPHVSVGVHLNLSVGPPIMPAWQIPSLVGSDGEFFGRDFPLKAIKRHFNVDEMVCELRAQIGVLREAGVRITHWESHQGRHLFPDFFQAAIQAAIAEGIPAGRTFNYYPILPAGSRLWGLLKYYSKHPGYLFTHPLGAIRMRSLRQAGVLLQDRRLLLEPLGSDAVYRPDAWQVLLDQTPEGVNIIECHPGYVDDDLRKYARLLETREKERQLFSDPRWLRRARDAGVEVISYHEMLQQRKGRPNLP